MPTVSEQLVAVKKQLQREIARRERAQKTTKEVREKYRRLLAESKLMEIQLKTLSHDILRAQEDERKKISRELHDDISQVLTGINVRLAALQLESKANAQGMARKIARAQKLVEKSVAIVHRFARKLRPAMLDDLGLIPALTSYMKEVRKQTGLQLHLTASKPTTLQTAGNLKLTVLFRVAQEALNNAAKHAHANKVDVSIVVEASTILLEVIDDGKSFPAQRILGTRRCKRLGLIGMRERVEMVGGTFTIESEPGKGTTTRACIPHDGDA